MIVEPVQPIQPAFGLKTQRVIRFDNSYQKRIIDDVTFNNRKSLKITKLFEWGDLTQKLYYLKDEAGKWVKSKLKIYKSGKLNKTFNNQNLNKNQRGE